MKQEEIIAKIKDKLEEINPMLALDGGQVTYLDYQDNVLFIKMGGHCMECMGQERTIAALLAHIQEDIPEVKNIINVPL